MHNSSDTSVGTRAARTLSGLVGDESGATAIEYGLIISLIVLAIAASIGSTGGGISARWNGMASTVGSSMGTN